MKVRVLVEYLQPLVHGMHYESHVPWDWSAKWVVSFI